MILDLVRDENVMLAFSDPAGAKAVLAFANLEREKFRSVVAVSDRVYEFYGDFGIDVERYQTKPAKEWLCTTNVEVLITGTSLPQTLEIDLILEANKAGVVTISFIDHWINMVKRFRVGNSLVLPDWICVVNERMRQIALNDGLPEEKLVIEGNPYHQFLKLWYPQQSRDSFLKNISLPSGSRYLLYAPEPISKFELDKQFGFDELDGLKMIVDALSPSLDTDKYIVVKGHPNQNHAVFLEYLAEFINPKIIYLDSGDFPTLIFYSECVIGFFSNSLVEAQVIGKRVIRPLMKLRSSADDVLEEMECEQFNTIRDPIDFAHAILAL